MLPVTVLHDGQMRCSACEKYLARGEFYKSNLTRRIYRCKACTRAKARFSWQRRHKSPYTRLLCYIQRSERKHGNAENARRFTLDDVILVLRTRYPSHSLASLGSHVLTRRNLDQPLNLDNNIMLLPRDEARRRETLHTKRKSRCQRKQ
eukprot:TRINITY_DN7552_c0_g1_i6.p1 TRINITY_DN7552_c0_g1~~TRINITY_DN7552_c0_g1_i6.p1  ORF type:complete len:149 (-),score=11.45 TRINITY_DN7552_c0_g1_i6:742-1188(-)